MNPNYPPQKKSHLGALFAIFGGAAVLGFLGLVIGVGGAGVKKVVLGDKTEAPSSRQEWKQIAQEIKDDMRTMADEQFDEDGVAQITDFKLPLNENAESDGQKLQNIVKSYFNDAAEANNAYLQELTALGYEQLMDPEMLLSDGGWARAEKILDGAQEAIAKARAVTDQIISDFPQRVERSDLSSRAKRKMIRGFRAEQEASKSKVDALWDLEERILYTIKKAVEHLEATAGQWTVEEELFVFEQDRDADVFNALIDEVGVLSEQQEQLRQNILTDVEAKIDSTVR